MLSTIASLRNRFSNHVGNAVTPSLLSRAEDRRLRAVEQSPEIAVWEDIHLVLVAHGIAGERLRHTCLALEQLPVTPQVAWRWIMAYDGNDFAGLLASGLSCYELVAHLELITVPQDLPRNVVLAS